MEQLRCVTAKALFLKPPDPQSFKFARTLWSRHKHFPFQYRAPGRGVDGDGVAGVEGLGIETGEEIGRRAVLVYASSSAHERWHQNLGGYGGVGRERSRTCKPRGDSADIATPSGRGTEDEGGREEGRVWRRGESERSRACQTSRHDSHVCHSHTHLMPITHGWVRASRPVAEVHLPVFRRRAPAGV